ncbi:MAPEG family protein [Aurantiacibacter sediminis]|uniref:MAPEG family protein n=1 Tax=Aurantiacibacter sediminis TaxID=2793064 RepID=A0ABS0N4Z7_9SPHN|nr:MAPEG family protein [Aurantiacibacter sediminis]MBH5322858.1 MAPEG family protein [Aurantiacibacter sediminis]
MVTILQPVVALVVWTLVMCLWMYATRLPAMAAAKVDPDSLAQDRDMSLEKVLEPRTQWKAHNFNHLHEAPTVFYAIMLTLALLSTQPETDLAGNGLVALLGWSYVALRVTHSVVQATWNKVAVRFALFSLSQITLIGLAGIAILTVFGL